VLKSVAF